MILAGVFAGVAHEAVEVEQHDLATYEPAGAEHVLALRTAARARWPNLPDVQRELQRLELIRTTYLPYGVSEWPASREQLLADVERLLLFLQQVFATEPSELTSARWTLIRARLVQALGRTAGT